AAVVGRRYRTNVFTRSVIAVLTHHRLEYRLDIVGIVRITAEIAIDTNPGHFLRLQHFMLTYNGYVIFCLAGYNTSCTTRAGIEVDRHAPMDAVLFVHRVHS